MDRLSNEKIVQILTDRIRNEGVDFFNEMETFLQEEMNLPKKTSKILSQKILEEFKEKAFPPVTRIEMFITENCPLRCDYCFVEGKNDFKRMSKETARKAVDFLIHQSAEKKDLNIIFFGGEPLLEFELMKEVIKYANCKAESAGKRITYDLTTNGVLIREEHLVFFQREGIKFLLSIDGDSETHNKHRKTAHGKGSYGTIIDKFPMMKKYQPWMGAKMTVHPDTAHKLLHNVRHLAEIGFNQFIIGAASGVDWKEDDWMTYETQMHEVAKLYREMRRNKKYFRMTLFEEEEDKFFNKRYVWGCQAGRHSLTISTDGSIYPCSKMLGLNELEGICRLGHIDTGITDIIMRGKLLGMGRVDRTKCSKCELLDCCKGGCFATNYLETKDIFKPSTFDCKTSAIQARVIINHLKSEKEKKWK
ncbi:MAG: SPASM domain-containing protein [Candidatus Schekmanbacteria bacterium]|nr:MAG: SPASM domain-containing protein [Candidatus Schekmanbacteria bacterium]